MPTSDPYSAPWVLSLMTRIKPQRILEAGIGVGNYGVLMRSCLDVVPGRLTRADWRVRIDGIEVFEGYRNPVWEYFYDQVWIGDVRELLPTRGDYDVILLADVIEHLTKEEGVDILRTALRRARYVIVTSPCSDYPQGVVCGNVHERHLSSWGPEDLAPFAFRYRKISVCFVALLASDPKTLQAVDFDSLPRLVSLSATRRAGILLRRTLKRLAEKVLGRRASSWLRGFLRPPT